MVISTRNETNRLNFDVRQSGPKQNNVGSIGPDHVEQWARKMACVRPLFTYAQIYSLCTTVIVKLKFFSIISGGYVDHQNS